jgi:RNA polymerase sigma-70 factor (ECF subfamily)
MEKTPCAASLPEPRALEDLIPAGRSGDRLALKLLIERYQFRMAGFVLAQTRDPNTVEDLCQAVFVKMVIGLPRLRDFSRFESWLFQIARNVCRDHRRAALGWRRYFVPYEAAHERVAMFEAATDESQLDNGVARLAPQDRALLRLHLEEKKSYREIADLSNTSVAAIKSRLYRARRELRSFLLAGDSE